MNHCDFTKVRFQETLPEHQARLHVAFNRVRTYRRILTALMRGRPITVSNDVPRTELARLLRAALARAGIQAADPAGTLEAILEGAAHPGDQARTIRQAAIQALMDTLKVRAAEERHTSRGEPYTYLVPAAELPTTPHLANAQVTQVLHHAGFVRFGGEGLGGPRTPVPYGLRREGDRIVPDPPASQAIAYALRRAPELETDGKVPWALVAGELNAQRFVRKDGLDWSGDDVRELTRTPSYAGY
ncbi:MAG: hypothetical protein JXM73_24280, partial [Anaerolineae bacterium]|nr:hypothetical protein [Anaerolineae bacterium]